MGDYAVAQGGTLQLPILVVTSAGSPVDPSALTLVLRDPDDAEQLSLELDDFTRISAGRYFYDWTAPVDADVGEWTGDWDAVIAGADAINVLVTIAVVLPGSLEVPPPTFTGLLESTSLLLAYAGDTPTWPANVGEDTSGGTLTFTLNRRPAAAPGDLDDDEPLIEVTVGDGITPVDAGRGWVNVEPGALPSDPTLYWRLVLAKSGVVRTVNSGTLLVRSRAAADIVPLGTFLAAIGVSPTSREAVLAALLLRAISDEIRRAAGRAFEGTPTQYDELYRLDRLPLRLRHMPVLSIDEIRSLNSDGTLADPWLTTDWFVHDNARGVLHLQQHPRYARVKYTTTGEIPAQVVQAGLEWAKARWGAAKRDPALASYSTGNDSESYAISLAGKMPAGAASAVLQVAHIGGGGPI